MKIDAFFDDAARKRVADAVRAAESATCGQIVPVVVERSGHYVEARYRGAWLAWAITTVAALGTRGQLGIAELALLQLVALAVGFAVGGVGPFPGWLSGRHAIAHGVHDRAARAFHEHGLARTRDATGVLVFASLYERAVVVLGDKEIDARMGKEGWQKVIDALVAGIQRGAPADGFCEAIRLCGEVLAAHFPRTGSGAGNELPDDLQVDRS